MPLFLRCQILIFISPFMRRAKFYSCLLLSLLVGQATFSQSGCEVNGQKGQTPASAIPVCGTTLIIQDSVPDCLNYPFPAPGCPLIGVGDYKDKNPFWYTFTCYVSGTLAFEIVPENADDNYNWQFYDITGHGASEIYSDGALVREANWSGSPGNTGVSSSGANIRECASGPGDNIPTFCKMPDLTEGHTYLLMVSHFNDGTQKGFTISFKGGSAGITDPALPGLLSAAISCDGKQVGVKLSKKMNCASIAADGSDFFIQGPAPAIISAYGQGCVTGFSTDSVIVNFNSAVAPGNYTVVVKKGNDGNTLVDNCGNDIIAGANQKLFVAAQEPAVMDSLVPPSCAPENLQLVFKKAIRCSSIAADGSDFKITGPYPVSVIAAAGNCINGLAGIIKLQLNSPLVHEGKYTITLLNGSDGNAITDACGLQTQAGNALSFDIKDTVNAAFTYRTDEGCRYDTVHFFNASDNGNVTWNWQFDNGGSNSQNPMVVYSSFGNTPATLIVSNGFCTDTTTTKVFLAHDLLKANFILPDVYCPQDVAFFKDSSTGNIISWAWQFGNGVSSLLQRPPPQVYAASDRVVPVQLIVKNNKGCLDTSVKYLKMVSNCLVAVPAAFSPNMDGNNDYLYPLNAYKTASFTFKVFNKFGQQLFSTNTPFKKWNGTFNKAEQPPGVYVWFLSYTDTSNGKVVFKKGTAVLVR